MSWIKRRGQAASPNPSSVPPVQMYNPNQHSNLQNEWQQQELQPPATNTWYTQNRPTQQKPTYTPNYNQSTQQLNYWQQQSYNPQNQTYNQNSANPYNQQYSQFDQSQSGYFENRPQQHNYSTEQPQQYNFEASNHVQQQQPIEADSWNWGWGDEDNSNVQNLPVSNTNANQANTITDSFAADKTWDWSVEDSNSHKRSNHNDSCVTPFQRTRTVENNPDTTFSQMGTSVEKHKSEEVKNNEKVNIENLPDDHSSGIVVLKKTDNLTPQWSTESQLSQDSSDLLHTSESDKSYLLSRSSTISESPISSHDPNFEINKQEIRNQLYDNTQNVGNIQIKADISSTNYYRQGTSNHHHENREVLSTVKQESKAFKYNPTPSPPIKNQTPPLPTPSVLGNNDVNPYKQTLLHKSTNKYKLENQSSFSNQTSYSSSNMYSQTVNLETLPDNSEQPDSLPHQTQQLRKVSNSKTPLQQWPENNEIASINDRNQYLETGQLSNNDYNRVDNVIQSIVETSDSLPPPSFPRMVLGQMEQVDNAVSNQDEPPPGLSRMVLGQTDSTSTLIKSDSNDRPAQRMVVGESSARTPPTVTSSFQSLSFRDEEALEFENQPLNQVRSATIGADTPPVTASLISSTANRSETIGADQPLPYTTNTLYSSSIRETLADGATLNENVAVNLPPDRRDSIEGQPQDSFLSTLVGQVKDLNIGENTTSSSITDRPARRSSRQESTDSEREHDSRKTKERKDRRYDKHEYYERDKARNKYSPSPELYREKKHDRRKYKDKRYEDDTDCYSDKEKDRKRDERDRRDDYDRKYSSLKRDKEKDRKRRDHKSHRDYGRDNRRNDYYSRYDDEYENLQRSRPSSRSDSIHDSYRHDRDRHRDRPRRNRDHYSYPQNYSFDPYNSYYQQYQYHYLENLRRTNPQAYAEWYHKYYPQSGTQQSYGNEERASVHSGRSSANDDLTKDRPFDQTESSLYLDETTMASQRLTPAKFATAHIKASISSGYLIKIFPHYPLDGQAATVEVSNLHDLLVNDNEYNELLEFPGPLVKGVTHKKTIIEYCESKIRSAIYNRDITDVDSYILMWELLILLLRQNGMVVGTDIAELLMKDRKHQASRRGSVTSNNSSLPGDPSESSNVQASDVHSSSTSVLKEEVITNKFRDYLLYGSGKEALEWAMKHGLWGHALFLASKLDKRTYANVMTRFANGLPINDPLQTLYQLLSGKVPSVVTSVADEKWGDWRPHLAMILSNTTQRPELDRKAITTLGDTLLSRGSLHAAHFCYLMAQVGFNGYGSENTKLVLLGSNHNVPFLEFAVNEAIYMTEIYEYACSLNDSSFIIPEFQPYKFLLATRLADRGLLEKALAYLEKISLSILQNPSLAQSSLITQVCELSDRLKYHDPVENQLEGDGDLDVSRPDNSWLKDLKTIQRNYTMGLITHQSADTFPAETLSADPSTTSYSMYNLQAEQEVWQQHYVDQQVWQPSQLQYSDRQNSDYQQNQQPQIREGYETDQYQNQQQNWPNQQQWPDQPEHPADIQTSTTSQQDVDQSSQNVYWNNNQTKDMPRPQISMPNQSKGKTVFDERSEDGLKEQLKKESHAQAKVQSQDKPATTGWFGGIWNKLSLRPKNQMKLPDDKNPTIVWDENKKQWVNLETEGDGTQAELKPPPKMSDMFPSKPQTEQPIHNSQADHSLGNANAVPHNLYTASDNSFSISTQNNFMPNLQETAHKKIGHNTRNSVQVPSEEPVAPKSNQPNIFKLQRSRNIKKAYVDVFNPGGKSNGGDSALPAPDNFASVPNNGPQMNYFVPAPIADLNAPTDFLTPAPVYHPEENNSQR